MNAVLERNHIRSPTLQGYSLVMDSLGKKSRWEEYQAAKQLQEDYCAVPEDFMSAERLSRLLYSLHWPNFRKVPPWLAEKALRRAVVIMRRYYRQKWIGNNLYNRSLEVLWDVLARFDLERGVYKRSASVHPIRWSSLYDETLDFDETIDFTVGSSGVFCTDSGCSDYQKSNGDNIIKYGHTKKGVQRYLCKTCGQTFTETKGTLFYRRQYTRQTIVDIVLFLLTSGQPISYVAQVTGIGEETILSWLRSLAQDTEDAKKARKSLREDFKLSQNEVKQLWCHLEGGD